MTTTLGSPAAERYPAASSRAGGAIHEYRARLRRGDLSDPGVLREEAAASDGEIHFAFRHDLMLAGDMAGAAEADLATLRALADGLDGSGKPLVGTTGKAMLAMGGVAPRRLAATGQGSPGPRHRPATVLRKVRRGELAAVHVTSGRRNGRHIQVEHDQHSSAHHTD